MNTINYFPLGIATGAAFCNRAAERLRLKQNIDNNQHTIFISPRRYGKTSLAHQAIKDNSVAWGEADFLTVADDEMVKLRILTAVEQALTQLFPPHQRILKKLVSYFKSLRPSLVMQADGAKIVLESSNQPLESIQDALQALDLAASNAKRRVILLFDEFQQIGSLKQTALLEGIIRHCAQFAKYVTYFFSGSNRHLLSIEVAHDVRRA
ncbi:MAG: hypothetical protein K2Q14_08905 [Gammaproteobacteria bacterium]|nr:hypothetical protein [Gammaproteobacteria bacterium]